MTIHVRKVGNSMTLTVPKSFNVKSGEEYTAEIDRDGTIIYRPAHKNPFEGDWFKEDIKQTDDMTGDTEVLDSEWG